jgi:hypothetical protein
VIGLIRILWTKQPLLLGKGGQKPDEVLEFASGDGEHAGLSRFNPVGMRNALGSQQRLPDLRPALLVPDAIAHLTFEHLEYFVLVMMEV